MQGSKIINLKTLVLNPRVYACFFPSDISQDQVRKMFEKYGTINVFRFYKRQDGFTYSYTTYDSIQQASLSIKQLHRKKIGDKTLKVSFAVPYYQPKMKNIKNLDKLQPNKNSKKQGNKRKIQRKRLNQKGQLMKLNNHHQNQDSQIKQTKERSNENRISQKDIVLFNSWLTQRGIQLAKKTDYQTYYSEQEQPYSTNDYTKRVN